MNAIRAVGKRRWTEAAVLLILAVAGCMPGDVDRMVLRKAVTAVVGLAACIVAVRLAFVSGNGVAFADVGLTCRTMSVLFCANCFMSIFAVLAGWRTVFAPVIATVLFALMVAFAPTAGHFHADGTFHDQQDH